ncbi:MAG TPA: sialidase family protein [Candidatus Binatia bacterium]|nr:sialidase family protein [Candidatus Binatia bacterium]
MSQNSKTHSREIYLVARSLFICLALAGCEQLPQLHLPQSTPQIVFDTAPVADPVLSAAVRVSRGPEENEDPSIILARDGRFYVAWSAKQRGRVDLFISSSADGRVWSEERRIHDIAAEDYNPALMQSRDGRFHLVWCQLQRKEGRTDVWYTTSKDGKVWDKPKSITNRGIDWAPTIYEDNKGTLRILWSSRRSGSRDIWVTRSLDGGKTWLAPDQVTRSSEEDDFPNALQAANGEHYLVWTRYRRGSAMLELHKDKSSDVVLATSRDAVVWSAPVVSSFADPDNKFVDMLPALFSDADHGQVFVTWTSGRTSVRGEILARSITSPSSHVFQLTKSQASDYSSKIVATRQAGEYLMVWVSTQEGKPDIFARRFKL